ncbi:hypothetical protein TWF281_010534 [Arthrobotrys megalospora]
MKRETKGTRVSGKGREKERPEECQAGYIFNGIVSHTAVRLPPAQIAAKTWMEGVRLGPDTLITASPLDSRGGAVPGFGQYPQRVEIFCSPAGYVPAAASDLYIVKFLSNFKD